LGDTKYYEKLDQPIYHENAKIIKGILEEIKKANFINKQQFKYLTGPGEYRPRNFYVLPKIHKKREMWPWPDMPEGRPICSDVNSETYRASEFINYFVNPLATRHETYIKNSYEFINIVQNYKIGESGILVTGDVSALYTN